MNNTSLVDKGDRILSFVITMTVLFLFIVNLSNGISSSTHIDYKIVSMLLKIILGILLLFCVRILIYRFNIAMLKVLIITSIIVIFNILLFPQNNYYFLNSVTTFFITCLPLIICILAMNNYSFLFDKLLLISYLITIIAVVVTILFFGGYIPELFNNSYAMGFSYSCLLPLQILFRDYIWKKRVLSLVSCILLFSIMVFFGSRGAILCFMVYLCIVTFRRNRYLQKSNTKLLIVFFLVLLLIIFNKPIINELNIFLNNIGIYSRTIYLFLQSEVYYSGRDILYSTIFNEVLKNPFLIRGINADYLLLGGYTHNIFLELLYEFGIIIGGLFALVIFYYSAATLFTPLNNDYVDLIIVFFCCSIPALLISGTFWTSYYFWLWLVLIINKGHIIYLKL